MTDDEIFLFLFLPVMLAILIWVVYVHFTKRGKGYVFGGKILKSFEEIKSKSKINTCQINIHAVETSSNKRRVGIDVRVSSFGGYRMLPISFTENEARVIAKQLLEAVELNVNT